MLYDEYNIQVPTGYLKLMKRGYLNAIELILLCYLEQLCLRDGGHTRIKNDEICDDLGLSAKQLRVRLQRLEELYFITRKMAYIPGAALKAVRYIEINTDQIMRTIANIEEDRPEV